MDSKKNFDFFNYKIKDLDEIRSSKYLVYMLLLIIFIFMVGIIN